MTNKYSLLIRWTGILLCSAVLTSCGSSKQRTVLPPPEVLSLETALAPGLPVYFRHAFYRNIEQMPSDESMIAEGEAGRPVAFLNHRFQKSVFDSKRETGVGVFLTGYLKIETSGPYRFKAMANDGIQITVNGEIVALDPTVHADRFSPVGELSIAEPGWYPLTVKYFQRKGTARLEFYWQTPGMDAFESVPAAAYGHVIEAGQ